MEIAAHRTRSSHASKEWKKQDFENRRKKKNKQEVEEKKGNEKTTR